MRRPLVAADESGESARPHDVLACAMHVAVRRNDLCSESVVSQRGIPGAGKPCRTERVAGLLEQGVSFHALPRAVRAGCDRFIYEARKGHPPRLRFHRNSASVNAECR